MDPTNPWQGLQERGKNSFHNPNKFILCCSPASLSVSPRCSVLYSALYAVHTSNLWKVAINTSIWDSYIFTITCIELVPGWTIIIYPRIYIVCLFVFNEVSRLTELLKNVCFLFTRKRLKNLKRESSFLALKSFTYHPRVQMDKFEFIF